MDVGNRVNHRRTLYLLNLAVFHGWASSGPPTPRPEWHRAWCYRFGVSAVLAFLAGLGVIWRLRPHGPKGLNQH